MSNSKIYEIIGRGLSSPISFDNLHTDRLFVIAEGLSVINQSIHAIIETRRGERYNNPNFGSDVALRIFEPNDYILKTTLKQDVSDALTRWEKRITLQDISVLNYDDDPRIPDYLILIVVSYRVNSTHQQGSYVYPFALNAMPMSEIINKGI
jgi:phage baseplate assembly protein W